MTYDIKNMMIFGEKFRIAQVSRWPEGHLHPDASQHLANFDGLDVRYICCTCYILIQSTSKFWVDLIFSCLEAGRKSNWRSYPIQGMRSSHGSAIPSSASSAWTRSSRAARRTRGGWTPTGRWLSLWCALAGIDGIGWWQDVLFDAKNVISDLGWKASFS